MQWRPLNRDGANTRRHGKTSISSSSGTDMSSKAFDSSGSPHFFPNRASYQSTLWAGYLMTAGTLHLMSRATLRAWTQISTASYEGGLSARKECSLNRRRDYSRSESLPIAGGFTGNCSGTCCKRVRTSVVTMVPTSLDTS